MREIGTVAQEKDARVLADYLLTRNITTKLEPRAGAWAVWVHREDQVPEARAVLAEFQQDPTDPQYRTAADAAKEIRKKSEKAEKEYQKRAEDLRDRWEGSMYRRAPLAFGLIIASVTVVVLMKLDLPRPSWVIQALTFTGPSFDPESGVRNTNFTAIGHGEVWRLVTPIFLHFGIPHLLFNMLAMRYLGEPIEMRKGTLRFALLVAVAAVVSNVGEGFVERRGIFGGMSGVDFALAGYLWIKGHTDPDDGLSLNQQSVNWMLGWFLLGILAPMMAGPNASQGFPYNMANVAHGVGLVVGMVFGLIRF